MSDSHITSKLAVNNRSDSLPLVIAIHGAVANAATWIPVRQLLSDTCELRASDLPGHGTRRREPFDLAGAIAEISAAVAEAASQRPVFLAGDSLGGYLALAVAAHLGTRVSGVIAGSCTFPMRGWPEVLARVSLVGDFITAHWPFVILSQLVAPPEVSAAIIVRGFAPSMRGITLRALLGRDIYADIAAITAPIIFVTGAFDIPIVFYAAVMTQVARRGSYRIVRRAGHGIGLTHPREFAKAIDDCIALAATAKF